MSYGSNYDEKGLPIGMTVKEETPKRLTGPGGLNLHIENVTLKRSRVKL